MKTNTYILEKTMLSILILACGGSLPPELENPYANPHVECPAETHFSSRGIGEDQATSIADAHAE